jgi:hypothetical protein
MLVQVLVSSRPFCVRQNLARALEEQLTSLSILR